ncbi:MAG: hypothetical protein RIT45_4122 [Pseudomonadota bacterium]
MPAPSLCSRARTGIASALLVVAALGCQPGSDLAAAAAAPSQSRIAAPAGVAPSAAVQAAASMIAHTAPTTENAANPAQQALAALRSAAFPVYEPADAAWLAQATVTQGPGWLAVSMPIAGATLYLEGNTQAETLDELDPATLPPLPTFAQPRVYENEQIWQADWVDEHGHAFTLHLECEDTAHDSRCQDGAEVLRLQQTLRRLEVTP